MVQSHCGILCSQCEYKKDIHCNTCLEIDNPFWGTCPIKACAKEKNHLYCGECTEFSCSLLNKFSYDIEQGDNGKRLDTCRQWAKDNL